MQRRSSSTAAGTEEEVIVAAAVKQVPGRRKKSTTTTSTSRPKTSHSPARRHVTLPRKQNPRSAGCPSTVGKTKNDDNLIGPTSDLQERISLSSPPQLDEFTLFSPDQFENVFHSPPAQASSQKVPDRMNHIPGQKPVIGHAPCNKNNTSNKDPSPLEPGGIKHNDTAILPPSISKARKKRVDPFGKSNPPTYFWSNTSRTDVFTTKEEYKEAIDELATESYEYDPQTTFNRPIITNWQKSANGTLQARVDCGFKKDNKCPWCLRIVQFTQNADYGRSETYYMIQLGTEKHKPHNLTLPKKSGIPAAIKGLLSPQVLAMVPRKVITHLRHKGVNITSTNHTKILKFIYNHRDSLPNSGRHGGGGNHI
jgi:hypothetical protein